MTFLEPFLFFFFDFFNILLTSEINSFPEEKYCLINNNDRMSYRIKQSLFINNHRSGKLNLINQVCVSVFFLLI